MNRGAWLAGALDRWHLRKPLGQFQGGPRPTCPVKNPTRAIDAKQSRCGSYFKQSAQFGFYGHVDDVNSPMSGAPQLGGNRAAIDAHGG